MRHKNDSFMNQLERYFNTYLPTVKGLSQSTINSYKATFRILMEFLYKVRVSLLTRWILVPSTIS